MLMTMMLVIYYDDGDGDGKIRTLMMHYVDDGEKL